MVGGRKPAVFTGAVAPRHDFTGGDGGAPFRQRRRRLNRSLPAAASSTGPTKVSNIRLHMRASVKLFFSPQSGQTFGVTNSTDP